MAGETKGWMQSGMKFGTGDDVGGGVEERGPLLALRVLVVTDLVPRAPHNAGASADGRVVRVDLQGFDELFTKLRPRLALEVPSVLAEGKNVRVDLSPSSLKSFRPDGLCEEVPLLRSLLDGRGVLERLRDGGLSVDRAESELERVWSGSRFAREILGLLPKPKGAEPAPMPAASAHATSAESLLDMIDMGGGGSSSAASAPARTSASSGGNPTISSLISQVAMSGKSGGGARPQEAIARVEKAIGAQIGAILQHPEVRRLEEAWRSLWFLVERSKGHNGIRIEVVCARPDEAAEALEKAIKAGGGTEPPVSLAVVDLAVDGTATGFARLEAISNIAEGYNVPCILNGSTKLLGVDTLGAVERLDNKGGLFAAQHQVPWRSAVSKPATRWVSIAMNRVFSRPAYDKKTSRVREASIQELPNDESAVVWLSPAHVIASLTLGSFRDTGWPCRIVGARSGGLVENLSVHEVRDAVEGADEGIAIPTEAFISTDTQRELGKCGVFMLASAPNSDACYVLQAPTAYVTPPKKTYDSATTEPEVRYDRVSLVDQLFVARLVQFLRALCSKIPPTSDPAEVQPVMKGALWALFEDAKPGSLEIDVKASKTAEGTVVGVTVRPRHFLGVALDELSLEMPLG